MKLEDAEAHELLELLFTNDNADLIVGQPEGIVTDVQFVALPKPGGGVTTKGLSPRASMLMTKLVTPAPVEQATPAQAVAIDKIVKTAKATATTKAKHPSAKPAPEPEDEDE